MTAHSNTHVYGVYTLVVVVMVVVVVARYKQTTYANKMRAIKQQPHNLQTLKHECFITLECIPYGVFDFIIHINCVLFYYCMRAVRIHISSLSVASGGPNVFTFFIPFLYIPVCACVSLSAALPPFTHHNVNFHIYFAPLLLCYFHLQFCGFPKSALSIRDVVHYGCVCAIDLDIFNAVMQSSVYICMMINT